MPFNNLSESSEETVEPQVTSNDPAERKLARRLRILRRQEAAKKRLLTIKAEEEEEKKEEEEDVPGIISKTPLETQISACGHHIYDSIDEGIEAVTNIQIAGSAYEVQRREQEASIRDSRMKYLEQEAQIAKDKFDEINAKWEKISKLNDPLDLYEETEKQKEKCKELLAMKDAVIHKLQEELKAADLKFIKDQGNQTAEINLLVQRINEQIKIMKRVLRTELGIIEDAIDAERLDLTEQFNKKWEALNRQREKEQVYNLEKKIAALEEHHAEMDRIMISHQEKYREAKISLEKDIQILQQELESVKAICLLNKEKVDYNYQVLKKRDEENLLIKSQQKRRINKLQDIATTLRRQINEMTENSRMEIKRLRAEVVNLYQKISDIEKKSKHFVSVNEIKFNQVWKFNTEQANQLLHKIMAMDQVIYEQILGLEWTLPEEYLKYLSYAPGKNEEKDEDTVLIRGLSFHEDPKIGTGRKAFQQRKQLLARHLLSIVADSTGFLVEDRLQELLGPYTKWQKTLVYLDNIFTALDVKNLQDVDILMQILDPYIDCLTCARRAAAAKVERKDMRPPLVPTEILTDTISTQKAKRDAGILTHLSNMVSQQKVMIYDVVSDITAIHRPSDFNLILEAEDDVGSYDDNISEDLSLRDDSISDFNDPQANTTKILLSLKSDDAIDQGSSQSHNIIKSFEQRQDQNLDRQSVVSPVEEKESGISLTLTTDEAKTAHKKINCRNPGHALTVEPVLVLKALRDFVAEVNEKEKSEIPLTLCEKLRSDHYVHGHKFSKEDVSNYWDGYRITFATKQEKLWDALLLGLQKYHGILQNRHVLNVEIQKLKTQNHDLKRLLKHYTIPKYVKSDVLMGEDDEFLPLIQTNAPNTSPSPEMMEPIQLKLSQFYP